MNKILHHYTSIETLKKILENKTLRFTRFDLMDDKTETDGLPENIKESYFLSCWVDEERENIPQWAMYAPEGVRISLSRNWHKKHPIPEVGSDKSVLQTPVFDLGYRKIYSFWLYPFEKWKDAPYKYIVNPLNEEAGFGFPVQYIPDYVNWKAKRWRVQDTTILYYDNENFPIRCKDPYWSFQNEYRFYLQFRSCLARREKCEIPEHIDLPVSEEILNEIKITLYPNCSDDDELKVQKMVTDLLSLVNPLQAIQRSELDGKWKPKH